MRDDRIPVECSPPRASGVRVTRRRRFMRLAGLLATACMVAIGSAPGWAQSADSREIMLGSIGKRAGANAADREAAELTRDRHPLPARAASLLAAARVELERGEPLAARKILESIIEHEPVGPVADEARLLLAPIYAGNYGTQGVVEGSRKGIPPVGQDRTMAGARLSDLRDGAMTDAAIQRNVDNPAGLAPHRGSQFLSPRVTRLLEQEFRTRVGDRVFFGEASTDVGAKSRAILAAQAAWLKRNPVVRVLIEAHAHDRGSRQHNLQLSLKRAEGVRMRLIEEGVSGDRIRIQAYGNEKPVADCDDPACAAQNRRVVSVLVGHDGARYGEHGEKRHTRP